jgi:tetratricopeptide (TPR) repeat protein
MTSWMNLLIAISASGLLLIAVLTVLLHITIAIRIGFGLRTDLLITDLSWLRDDALKVVLLSTCPLVMTTLLRFLRWPQLVLPTAIAVLTFSASPLCFLTAWSLGNVRKTIGTIGPLLPSVTTGAFITVVCIWVVWRLRFVYGHNRPIAEALRDEAERGVPASRRAGGILASAVSVTFTAFLMTYVAWSGYSLAMKGSADRSAWDKYALTGDWDALSTMSRTAYNHFQKAYAKQIDNRKEAEQEYRRALEIWDAVARACPHFPTHHPEAWVNVLLTYNHLASVQMAQGQFQDAERSLTEAVVIDERLVSEFPNWSSYRQDLDRLREQLALLRRLISAKHYDEGRRLQGAGRMQAASAAFRRAVRATEERFARDPEGRSLAPRKPGTETPSVGGERLLKRYQARTLNTLAWLLATCPDPEIHDPTEAIDLAVRAVAIEPDYWKYWNTLGVAHCEAGHWEEAQTTLQESMRRHFGGNGFNWFPLAIVSWHLGDGEDAKRWYDRAVGWMTKNPLSNNVYMIDNESTNDELHRFRIKAANVLGLSGSVSGETGGSPRGP